ncbi:MAG: TfoX/Sxy family protein [Chitinophagaceae bacterium]|nr:TfoX/Sxy family protein [Chitinophagaceae bacterium]
MINEALTRRIRDFFERVPKVEEKKMFSGIAFMVDGKLCVSVGNDRIMCRIDPALHDQTVKNNHVRTVIMKGKEYKGYIHVDEAGLKTKKELDHWLSFALDFNPRAKSSVKKKTKK